MEPLVISPDIGVFLHWISRDHRYARRLDGLRQRGDLEPICLRHASTLVTDAQALHAIQAAIPSAAKSLGSSFLAYKMALLGPILVLFIPHTLVGQLYCSGILRTEYPHLAAVASWI